MTGLIYKEFRQNKLFIISCIFVPFIPLIYYVLFSAFTQRKSLLEVLGYLYSTDGQTAYIFLIIAGLAITAALQQKIFKCDESRKWALFIATSSEGIKGFLYVKYILVFVMGLLYIFSMELLDSVLSTVYTICTNNPAVSVTSSIAMPMFYFEIFLISIDLLLIIRFGSRTAEYVKLILFIILAIAVVMLVNMWPLQITDFLIYIKNALLSGNGRNIILIKGVQPFACIFAYVVSYYISCKIYLKGVNQYGQ